MRELFTKHSKNTKEYLATDGNDTLTRGRDHGATNGRRSWPSAARTTRRNTTALDSRLVFGGSF
jgi:hypothetical protein